MHALSFIYVSICFNCTVFNQCSLPSDPSTGYVNNYEFPDPITGNYSVALEAKAITGAGLEFTEFEFADICSNPVDRNS